MTKLQASLLASVAAASVIVACTSTSSGGDDNGSSGGTSSGGASSGATSSSGSSSGSADAQQCSDLANAACKILAQCDTFDMQALFAGSTTTCAARLVYSCPSVSESGTSNSGSTIEACAAAVGQLTTCDAYASYLASTNGNLCATKPGTLANGVSCFDDSQCSGGFCGASVEEAGSDNCGSCAATPPATACQENSNCPSGELCNGQGTCVTPGEVGATCDSSDPSQANQPCQPYLFCKFASPVQPEDGGAAPTSGTCAALLASDAACDSTDFAEECDDGLFCNAQNQCASVTFVPLGGACDDVGLVCAGASCEFTNADANADGVCTAYAADGATCQQDADCQYGASCQSGKCSTAVATSCD